jgi:CRP-like cAMP-binding protein
VDPKIRALRAQPVFAGLSERELEVFGAHLDEVQFPVGATLIEQGQPNHTFYVVADGTAEVVVDGEHRRHLHAGDFFGEISMEGHVPATATVVAKTALRALVMSHQQYRALHGNDVVLDRVLETLQARLKADQTAHPPT